MRKYDTYTRRTHMAVHAASASASAAAVAAAVAFVNSDLQATREKTEQYGHSKSERGSLIASTSHLGQTIDPIFMF